MSHFQTFPYSKGNVNGEVPPLFKEIANKSKILKELISIGHGHVNESIGRKKTLVEKKGTQHSHIRTRYLSIRLNTEMEWAGLFFIISLVRIRERTTTQDLHLSLN